MNPDWLSHITNKHLLAPQVVLSLSFVGICSVLVAADSDEKLLSVESDEIKMK